MKKIPGANSLLQPDIDMWGREKTYGATAERVFENLLSPGYYEKVEMTPLDKELERLYKETGDNAVFPPTFQKYFTVDNEKIYLSAEEFTEYSKLGGQKRYELAQKVISSAAYKKATAQGKINMLSKCWTGGRDYAKDQIMEQKGKK